MEKRVLTKYALIINTDYIAWQFDCMFKIGCAIYLLLLRIHL